MTAKDKLLATLRSLPAMGEKSLKSWGLEQRPQLTGRQAEELADALVADGLATCAPRPNGEFAWRAVIVSEATPSEPIRVEPARGEVVPGVGGAMSDQADSFALWWGKSRDAGAMLKSLYRIMHEDHQYRRIFGSSACHLISFEPCMSSKSTESISALRVHLMIGAVGLSDVRRVLSRHGKLTGADLAIDGVLRCLESPDRTNDFLAEEVARQVARDLSAISDGRYSVNYWNIVLADKLRELMPVPPVPAFMEQVTI